MTKLEHIGFYTLSDKRAARCSITSPMTRACFMVTGRCNFSCPYCNGPVCKQDFDTDKVVELLHDLAQHGLEAVRFTGGEPTLHKGLLDMVAAAKKVGISNIAISTNGSARPELYSRLVDEGANDFSISADCKDVETAARLSGVPGTWERVKENIRALSARTCVIIGTTVTDENHDTIPETLKFLADLGVTDIKLATATQMRREISVDVLSRIDAEILARMPVLRYRVEHYKAGRPVRGLVEGRDSKHCWWVQDDIVLAPSGHYPCIVYPRERGLPIGPLDTVANMRAARLAWARKKNVFLDSICKTYCMDIFADCNRRIEELQGLTTIDSPLTPTSS